MPKGELPPGLKKYLDENRDKAKPKNPRPKKQGETKIMGYSVPVYNKHGKGKPHFTQNEDGSVIYHSYSLKTSTYSTKTVIGSDGLPNSKLTETRLRLLLKKGIVKN